MIRSPFRTLRFRNQRGAPIRRRVQEGAPGRDRRGHPKAPSGKILRRVLVGATPRVAPRWPAREDRVKAIQYRKFGGSEVLELVELPDPHPAPGQLRVAVRAVGVNPIDWKLRSGMRGGALPQRTGGAAELALSAEYAPIPPSLDFAVRRGLGGATPRARP